MKTNPNSPAAPVKVMEYNESIGGYEPVNYKGVTKREHFAAMATDDFENLNISDRCYIAGDPPSQTTQFFDEIKETHEVHGRDYVQWLLKGRAKWKLMQADALIEALNKQGE